MSLLLLLFPIKATGEKRGENFSSSSFLEERRESEYAPLFYAKMGRVSCKTLSASQLFKKIFL